MNTKRRSRARMGLVAVAASSALVLGACGGGQARGQQGGSNAGASGSSACAAASQVLDKPQTYAGKQVTVTGTMGQVVGPNAFTMTTISKRFPTTAISAISKIGASESLFTARIVRAPFIPTMC